MWHPGTSSRAGDRAGTASERGAVLLITLLVMGVVMVLGGGLVLVTATEIRVAATYQDASRTLYAAEAALDLVLAGLAGASDLDAVLSGAERSAWTDGAPGGTRPLGGGAEISLDGLTSRARCGRPRPCSEAQMDLVTQERPWGVNNARWTPYVYGRLAALLPVLPDGPPLYIVAWVGDDGLETDGDPWRDAPAGRPGHGLLRVRMEAHGTGQRRAFEAEVSAVAGTLVVHSWQELR